ncbi:MAG TPA: SHOCT domain-containing protein [Nitrospirota bacterium]|jgi:hypothetical protein
MNWSFSFKLQPGEELVEEPADDRGFGFKPVHTPILTNRRAMFRFNTLSSGLIQSFGYDEIEDVRPANRLMIKYLRLKTKAGEYYLNVDDPEEWALKILGYQEMLRAGMPVKPGGSPPAGYVPDDVRREGRHSPSELLDMLAALRDAGVLTDAEYEEKKKLAV